VGFSVAAAGSIGPDAAAGATEIWGGASTLTLGAGRVTGATGGTEALRGTGATGCIEAATNCAGAGVAASVLCSVVSDFFAESAIPGDATAWLTPGVVGSAEATDVSTGAVE